MKSKAYSLLMLLFLAINFNTTWAQSPESIKYQAVLRDASGNVIPNASKTVVVNILQGSSSGTSVYQETHSVTTTAQGVINLNIGGGTVNSGTFATINWSTNTYWAKLTVDGTEITNGQLLSTPYALSVKGITYDPTNSRVGIGTTSPSDKLTVNGNIRTLAGGDIIFERESGGGTPSRIYSVDDDLNIATNGTTRIYAKNDGNVGIGTVTPASKFTVNGDIKTLAGGDIILERSSGGGNPSRFYNDNDDLYINTNNATRMFINSSGYVGIGTTSPGYKLDVAGVIHSTVDNGDCFRVGNDATINDINQTNGLGIYGASNPNVGNLKLGFNGPLLYGNDLTLGINTNEGGAYLRVNGNGNQNTAIIEATDGQFSTDWPSGWGGGLATNDICASGIKYSTLVNRSDERLKKDIKSLNDMDAIEKIKQLRPVSYYWKDPKLGNALHFGFIAQEVEKVFPNLVATGSDAEQTKSVNYVELIPVLMEALIQQQKTIDELKAKLNME